jgi:hypothetical protein
MAGFKLVIEYSHPTRLTRTIRRGVGKSRLFVRPINAGGPELHLTVTTQMLRRRPPPAANGAEGRAGRPCTYVWATLTARNRRNLSHFANQLREPSPR